MKSIFLMAILTTIGTSAMADLGNAPVVFESGKWTVRHDIDKMTDAVSCTGIYDNDFNIQLSKSALYVRIKGGIEAYKFRFDESPPTNLQLASKIEKDVGSLIIDGDKFNNSLKSHRVRVQVTTLVSGLQDIEIDTSNMVDALENIKQGCPKTESIQAKKTTGKGRSLCNDVVLKRMTDRQLTQDQIDSICEP